MKNFTDYGINTENKTTGNIKTICPACTPHMRKAENRRSKDLSVNLDNGVWLCHNCGWKGSLNDIQKKEYFKPTPIHLPLSSKAINWFKNERGITESTLKNFQITEKMEYMPQVSQESNCIVFPYLRNNQWVNAKFRDGKKNFKMVKDAELILFNLDKIVGQKEAIIVEGEIDCMTVSQCGLFHVVSVPNGASKSNAAKLEYIDNCFYAFSECEKIYIATDSDEAGTALKLELCRRLGRDRCYDVHYPTDCKDFNEVLLKHNSNKVIECIREAKPFPLDGILRLTDFMYELDDVFENGFNRGVTVGYSDFDELLNFSPGQLTVVTGIPNSGKSAFIDQLLIRLAMGSQWRMGVCSFENQPITNHAANLSSLYVGKSFFSQQYKMSVNEYNQAKVFLNEYFYWFKLNDADCTIDGILERGKQLVKVYGIKALLIDPYNYIEHKRPSGMSETEYISLILTAICNFAKQYGVHVFLVAHPTKIKKDINKKYEVPTLYDIAGSAHWFNKADNGIVVYRNDGEKAGDADMVTVYVQKVRWKHNGKKGYAEFKYNIYTGEYLPTGEYFRYETERQNQSTSTYIPDNPSAGINNRNKLQDFDDYLNELNNNSELPF